MTLNWRNLPVLTNKNVSILAMSHITKDDGTHELAGFCTDGAEEHDEALESILLIYNDNAKRSNLYNESYLSGTVRNEEAAIDKFLMWLFVNKRRRTGAAEPGYVLLLSEESRNFWEKIVEKSALNRLKEETIIFLKQKFKRTDKPEEKIKTVTLVVKGAMTKPQ